MTPSKSTRNKRKATSDQDIDTPTQKKPKTVVKGHVETLARALFQKSGGKSSDLIPVPHSVVQTLGDSWQAVAFIMDFATTADLHAFYTRRVGQTQKPDIAAVIESWWNVRDNTYDLNDPSLGLSKEECNRIASRKKRLPRKKVITEVGGFRWRQLLCDEAQRVHDPTTTYFQAIIQLCSSTHWFLTATPMWNRAVDIYGYLLMLTKNAKEEDFNELESVPLPTPADATDDRGWEDVYSAWAQNPLPKHRTAWPWALMHPANFRLLSYNAQLTPNHALMGLRVIFKMVQLQRDLNSEILRDSDRPLVIGSGIPACYVHAVDLRFTDEEQARHDALYHKYVGNLFTMGDGETPTGEASGEQGLMNWEELRKLCFLGVSRKFFRFHCTEAAKKEMNQPLSAPDRGPWFVRPQPKPRMLLFCQWPQVAWLVEMFIVNLGFKYARILASDKQSERTTAIKQFNDPTSSCQFLVTTFNVGLAGLNLQKACFVEVHSQCAMNHNQTFQAIGRVNRFGQTQIQHVHMLNMLHTRSTPRKSKSSGMLPRICDSNLGLLEGDRHRSPMKNIHDLELKGAKPTIRARNRLTRRDPGYQEDLEAGVNDNRLATNRAMAVKTRTTTPFLS
ncbi:hypothetical protein N7492_007604 [Penicillium capsulatum]|uniref:Helicase C-terminal domain-containing protein n=1 Tax=Penicillium capsulatum TaxID=69766 RepID=A0A9W9LL04_9EURO|nr:hypothetical protein N7492_007604 [Penicillium capsulatum]KAJ6117439.1 hypothetical protein N7512_007164 [Penicillium capsulatum]